MNPQLEAFFDKLDHELKPDASEGEILDLYLLGGAALVLQFQKPLATTDVDIIGRNRPIEDKALEILGKGTQYAETIGLYLDTVEEGAPVPHGFEKRSELYDGPWNNIRVWQLNPHDLAATKLKRFSPQDRQDIQFLCDEGLLDGDALKKSLQLAFLWNTEKDGDPDFDRARTNLDQVIEYLEGRQMSL